jgi:hypothetical protein
MVNLLTDIYALEVGVQPLTLESIRKYRDQLMRFRALQRRQSGTYIAKLLLQTQHDKDYKKLERVLSDALRYLGYQVKDLAKAGQPEGIASAYAFPTLTTPTKEDPEPPLYSFSFDAKSSQHEAAKTGNIDLAAVVAHRTKYKADHALVLAPGYTGEAIGERCTQQRVTPMTARDLGKLLEYTVAYGAIPITNLREVFYLYRPEEVAAWVAKLEGWLKEQRPFTINIFLNVLNLNVLKRLKGQVPDVLSASTIALECRRGLGAYGVKDQDVIAVARGLSILIPDLVGIDGDKVVVNASPERVAAAVESQFEQLRDEEPLEIENDGG